MRRCCNATHAFWCPCQRTVPMFRTSVLPFAAEPPFTTDSGNHWGNFFARTKMTNSALSGSTGGVGGGCAAAVLALDKRCGVTAQAVRCDCSKGVHGRD